MASENAKNTHFRELIESRPYPNTRVANITSKILRFLHPPFNNIYSVILNKDQEKPTLTVFYILLTILIIALIIASYCAYKQSKERCKRLLNEHEAIKPILNEERNQNIGNNTQIPLEPRMMMLGSENVIEAPLEQPMEAEIKKVFESARVPEALTAEAIGDRPKREIKRQMATGSNGNANLNQVNPKQRTKKFLPKKAPQWRP